MAAVNTFNSEEIEDTPTSDNSLPKNFDLKEDRKQHDDTEPIQRERNIEQE
jgi:hypothetical protein